jgi:HTH-type transcriptional regulator / antitoxin HigA
MSVNFDPQRSNVPSPGELIRQEMKVRGWTQADLARILDRPLPTVNEIILGKRAIMPEMAMALGEAFSIPAEIWMQREATYRLSLADGDFHAVRRRARVHSLAPLKELQRRGWIKTTDDPTQIESELLRFFEIDSLEQEPEMVAALRKTDPEVELTLTQRAWCFRVKQLARSIKVAPFDPSRLSKCADELRRLAAFPTEARKVAGVLGSYGIRFVIVEPLSGGRIDGAAMWLDTRSPVIGMTIRFDRIDSFWFTLGHEFSHIVNGDSISIDADLSSIEQAPAAAKSPIERRADEEAAALLVAPDELRSFILRVGPRYSKERIIQFAHRIKIHPGIIVGQLQKRGEIGYNALRELLVKVRETASSTSVTDGWGYTLDSGVSE